jgi:hypothetical protein
MGRCAVAKLPKDVRASASNDYNVDKYIDTQDNSHFTTKSVALCKTELGKKND